MAVLARGAKFAILNYRITMNHTLLKYIKFITDANNTEKIFISISFESILKRSQFDFLLCTIVAHPV